MAPYRGELLSNSVAEHIGSTPLVRLNRLPTSLHIKAKICAKLEYFNASESVKDRIARRMAEQAEHDGLIKPGETGPRGGHTLWWLVGSDVCGFTWLSAYASGG
ncbi:hypothetical protein AbraIFM66950_005111 [Aspergillus brasiliensis]|nr:hypothetical protein AbraIFM66950_005111 [Aspergillus brasiliensis]